MSNKPHPSGATHCARFRQATLTLDIFRLGAVAMPGPNPAHGAANGFIVVLPSGGVKKNAQHVVVSHAPDHNILENPV
jgi:hypothetical protein